MLDILIRGFKEWELVQIKVRDRAKDGLAYRWEKPSTKQMARGKGGRKDQDRSKTPIVCHACGDSGHILKQRKKSKQESVAERQGKR